MKVLLGHPALPVWFGYTSMVRVCRPSLQHSAEPRASKNYGDALSWLCCFPCHIPWRSMFSNSWTCLQCSWSVCKAWIRRLPLDFEHIILSQMALIHDLLPHISICQRHLIGIGLEILTFPSIPADLNKYYKNSIYFHFK